MKSSHAPIALASGLLVAVIATIPANSANGATKTLRTAPLIRGTLWWLVPNNHPDWSRSEYEAAIDKQRDIGFRLLWILNTPALYRQALESRKQGQTDDILEWISFFTLDDREPFFAAIAEACRRAGAEFWVNVETGECQVANWDEYIEHEKKRNVTKTARLLRIFLV